MYIPHYHSLKTNFKTNLKAIKTIDWFNNQYERYSDLKAVRFPALYIDFGIVSWQDMGRTYVNSRAESQLAEANITLHIVHFSVGDSPEALLSLSEQVHRLLQGKPLKTDEKQISTVLSRTTSELITDYDQLKVMRLTYKTALFD